MSHYFFWLLHLDCKFKIQYKRRREYASSEIISRTKTKQQPLVKMISIEKIQTLELNQALYIGLSEYDAIIFSNR